MQFNTLKMSLLPKRKSLDLQFYDLKYTVPGPKKNEPKVVLKNISGVFKSGYLTAIMGPSGAGKTTLMNILAAYRVTNVEGTILVNGKKKDERELRKMSSYIMQEDNHFAHFSVHEAMVFSSNLKLGDILPDSTKQEVIHEILETLSLVECSNTRTTDLSGGQRKRLSIAVELVNNPPIMFFDEPTSGLDSQNSLQCINLLKRLAEEGRNIVCTIHQPSARLFEMFDQLYAISDGLCIYRGTVNNLLPFLSKLHFDCPPFHNPADFLIEIASGSQAEKMADRFSDKNCFSTDLIIGNEKEINGLSVSSLTKVKDYINNGTSATTEEGTSFLDTNKNGEVKIEIVNKSSQEAHMFATTAMRQTNLLIKRNFITILRDSMLTKLRLVSHLSIGLLIGVVFYNIGNDASKVISNSGLIFCCILFNIFAGMMPTLLTFPLEMKVFVREHHNCWYSLKAYYIAKMISDIPFQVLYPIVYALIVYFMTDQPYELGRFGMFTFICILTSLVAQSFAVVLGAGMEIEAATFTAPIVSIPILLFSGFFVPFEDIPVYLRWLSWISYMRYSFEGASVAIYDYQRRDLECTQPYCHFKSTDKILELFSLLDSSYLVDCLALVLFFLAFRVAGYFVLRWRIRRDR